MQTTGTHERVMAGAVDVGIMGALVLATGLLPTLRFRGIDFSPACALAGSVLAVVYALYELTQGASPAKQWLGLHIARNDGRPTKPGQLALRWMMKHVPVLALVLGNALLCALSAADPSPFVITVLAVAASVVGAVAAVFVFGYFLIFDGLRQALHDVLAGTGVFVVRTNSQAEDAFEALELGDPLAGADDPAAAVRPDPTRSRPTGDTDRSAARHATTP